MCAEKGVAVEDLQDILGHKKISTTKEFYLHKDTVNNPIRDAHINRIFSELNSDMKEISRVKEQNANPVSADIDNNEEKTVNATEVSSKPIGYFRNGVFHSK